MEPSCCVLRKPGALDSPCVKVFSLCQAQQDGLQVLQTDLRQFNLTKSPKCNFKLLLVWMQWNKEPYWHCTTNHTHHHGHIAGGIGTASSLAQENSLQVCYEGVEVLNIRGWV